jgi:hypothetical protein
MSTTRIMTARIKTSNVVGVLLPQWAKSARAQFAPSFDLFAHQNLLRNLAT